MKITIEIKQVSSFPDNDQAIARVFYPHEGNRIYIKKGMSLVYVEDAIFHEIGHVIDWYLSNNRQSKNRGRREKLANMIGDGLYRLFVLTHKNKVEDQ